jgi:septum formation protein
MHKMQKIILASQSPRRKQLLEWAEIDFDVIVTHTDESFPAHLNYEDAAIHIARNKALAVLSKTNISIPILAADTIVVCNDQLIGKPKDREDAVKILEMLSGKEHKVILFSSCLVFT